MPLVGKLGAFAAGAAFVVALSTCDIAGLRSAVELDAGLTPETTVPNPVAPTTLPTPVGEYLFNGDYADSSGRNPAGTIIGGTGFVADRHGKAYSALSVNDIGGANVDLGTSFQFTDSSSFTVSLWFNTSTYGGSSFPCLLSQQAMNGGEFQYFITIIGAGNQIQAQVGPNGIASYGPAAAFTLNAWHNVVLVYDGTTQTVAGYLDGSSFGESPASYIYTLHYATGQLALGGGGVPDYTGALDDVKIYNYAMTADQVSTLYVQYP